MLTSWRINDITMIDCRVKAFIQQTGVGVNDRVTSAYQDFPENPHSKENVNIHVLLHFAVEFRNVKHFMLIYISKCYLS